MTSSPAASTSLTGTVVILGRTPTGIALEGLCARAGVEAVLLDSIDAVAGSGGASSSAANCGLLVDARREADRRSANDLEAVEASMPASALLVLTAQHRTLGPLIKFLGRPDRVAGLVQPVDYAEADFAEVIRTASTSDETVARLAGVLQQLGKKTLVVRDSAGFFSSRLAVGFLNEGMSLVGEGVPAAQVESAAREAGMPVGPLEALDRASLKLSDDLLHQELHDLEHEAKSATGHGSGTTEETPPIEGAVEVRSRSDHDHGHDHGHDHDHDHAPVHEHGHAHDHAHHHAHDDAHDHNHDHAQAHDHDHDHDHAHEASPAPHAAAASGRPKKHVHKVKSKRMPEPAVYVMEKMAHGYRRMGREAGAGFYEYADDGSTTLWSGLKAFERRGANVAKEDIKDRMIFIQVLEAVRCLEEGVVDSPADADAASVGLCGFPAAKGGAIRFIDQLGLAKFTERAAELASRYGERFLPPAGLAALIDRREPPQDRPVGHATAG